MFACQYAGKKMKSSCGVRTWIVAFSALACSASAPAEHLRPSTEAGYVAGERHAEHLAAKPEFLIEAQRNLDEAQAALQAEQRALDLLRQQEAKLRRSAIMKNGSWIEPSDLWTKKELLKQAIARKQQAVDSAVRRLKHAENQAHAITESTWSKKHRPSWFGSWWKW
jgi:Skp family chaperone for outer membrane proteins